MHHQNFAISLILPAFNESRTIQTTLAEVSQYFRRLAYNCQIIVAADGDDGTRERAQEFARQHPAVQVIGQPERRGKGRGIREGVKLATGSVIGFLDADNKVPISEFGKLEPWLNQGYDIVMGSRAMEASQIERKQPWYRQLGSQGFYLVMQTVVGIPGIGDTQCGFKFFRREVARDLFSRQRIDGYMFDIEILALAQRLGYRIQQVPIRWRDDADSRLELFRGNIRNVVDLFRIRSYCRQFRQAPANTRAAVNVGER